MSKKAGRNDPCPCGSGKKYKKCCQANEAKPGGGVDVKKALAFGSQSTDHKVWGGKNQGKEEGRPGKSGKSPTKPRISQRRKP